MLCQKCKNREATVHLVQNINGMKSDLWLCPECAGETSEPFFGFSAGSLFSDFFSDSMLGRTERGNQKICPVCKMTTAELAGTGRPGCPKCYEIFENEIDGIVKGIHGNARHTGSVPGKHAEKIGIKRKISELKKEQEEAIKTQNYEKAAELRDKIKVLEAGTSADNGNEEKDGKEGK